MTKQSTKDILSPVPTKAGTGAPAISGKADALAFSLGGENDFLDLACDQGQNAYRRTGLHVVKLLESYKKGDIGVVFEFSAGVHAEYFDLTFFAIPAGNQHFNTARKFCPFEMHLRSKCADRHQEPMFIGVTELIEGPEGVIPSLVRIETSKKRADLAGQVLASPLYHTVQISNRIGDGEISLFGFCATPENGGGISGLIEGGPKRLQRFDGGIGPAIGKIARELERVGRDAFRIRVLDTLVWFLLQEGADTFLKPSRVFLTALEPTFWAFKGIGFSGHGRKIQK